MAQLKDLIVNGASRFIGDIFGTNATFSGDVMPETDNVQSLGDSTHRWKIYGAITGSLDKTFKVKLNNTQYTYDGSADIDLSTIYAPTAGGTANTQALVGNGATATPKWVNISPSISITAGTSSATPKVNVTVLGQSGTAQGITTATTGVYGATKLTDVYTSTDATLAATGKSILAAIQTLAVSAVGGGTGEYISKISETDGKIVATKTTTTVSNTWTDGTTAGPTIKTTVNDIDGTAVAIPSASASVSGVVTTGTQTFAGDKTFNDDISANTLTITSTGGIRHIAFSRSTKPSYIWAPDQGGVAIGANETLSLANTAAVFDKISVHPGATNTFILGTSDYRWKALYIGTTDSYGGQEQPIYWNDGVPEAGNPVWTLKGGSGIPSGTDLNTVTTIGNYWNTTTTSRTILNNPYSEEASSSMQAYQLKVETSFGSSEDYLRQQLIIYNSGVKAERHSNSGGSSWSSWRVNVFKNSDASTKEGDNNKPIYIAANGKATAIDYSIDANINSGTKDYIAYYSGKNTISQTAHAHFNWTELSGTTKGYEELVLGDKTNQFGRLALYGKANASGGAYIVANNASSWLTHTFPDTAGWIVTAGNGSSTGAGAADRPIYVSTAGVATQTTYRMAGTNANATTGLTFSDDLNTGIWYVNGITADEDKASLYNQSDGAIIANRYNDNWISEIYQDYRTGQLAIRGKNSGTWQPWRKVLDSTNYTLYSGNARIFYGTCSTAAGTAEKDVTCTAYDALTVGDIIFVTFANTNSGAVGSLKLDVNGKGAKPIKYLGNATKSNLPSAGYIIKDTPYRFVYDGTNWVMDLYYNTNTNTLLRTYASATNIDVPLIGQSSAASTTAAWSTYTGIHKDWYGVIPNDDTKRAKINLSTGAMTVPGGITSGKFIANHVSGENQEFLIRYNDEDIMSLELGIGNVNHGIYDYKNSKWMIYADNSGNINMNGNALTANAISPAGNSGQFWRGDNTWNNTINSYIGSYRESTTAQNWPSGIYFTTKDTTTTNSATGYIYCYQDHGSPSWGLNMVIQPTGNLIIGSGESPGSFYANAILGKTVSSNETTVGASSASFMENGEQTIITSDSRIYFFTNCNTIDNRNLSYIDTNGYYWGTRVYGAVWNDYAEYRKTQENIQPGRCIKENGDDSLSITTKRLERGCEIVSDTFGFAIGENNESKTPTAASGRVLAYPYESREEFASHIGWPVCSGPNGTVSIMTEEEEEKYPSRIIGTISAVPDYEEWGTGNVKVDGRVWIRIR